MIKIITKILFWILVAPLIIIALPFGGQDLIYFLITSKEQRIKDNLKQLDRQFELKMERFKKEKGAIKYLRVKKKSGYLTDIEEIDKLNFLESVYSNRLRNEYLTNKEWLLEDLKKEQ